MALAPRQSGHTSRQRLRPWLIDQINSGGYPGLKWIDQAQMIFQISWKHFGKPGVNEERDAKIFREWAKHTGKYKDGDPPDPSTWKTRFRCALYKLQDIEEINSMNMLDGDEPYRVYRFRSRGKQFVCLFVCRFSYGCLRNPEMQVIDFPAGQFMFQKVVRDFPFP